MLSLHKQTSQEFSFDDLKANDQLIINTHNNQYRFELIDPHSRLGTLTGGRLGQNVYEATLLYSSQGTLKTINEKSISIEATAIFLVKCDNMATHLYTSRITNLTLLRYADLERDTFKSLQGIPAYTTH